MKRKRGTMSEEGVINFDVDSHLLIQLGERSATRRFVALAELIKNSYDADATKATVRMYNVKEPCGKIIVEDDGHGMTFEILKKTWMRIATTDKRKNPVSIKYKRAKAGEKGIGRMVCRRLSNRLTLKSVAEKEDGTKEETLAHFNWADFKPGSDISDIQIKYTTRPVSKDSKTGTTLILEDTKDAWSKSDIKNLKRELYELIDPSYYLPGIKKEKRDTADPGFHIDFDLPEFSREAIKPLEKNIIEGAWGRLSGLVDDKGKAIYTLNIYGEFDKKLERQENFKYLKLANMDVILFLYKPEYVKADIGVRKLKNIIRQYSGIKVYYGDFRLFGYGYPGDDWLSLDKDRAERRDELSPELREETIDTKRPGLALFGNNQLLGYVTYSHRDNPDLKITITREHLEKNEAFNELKKFVRLGIELATVRHAHEVFLKKKTEAEAELEAEKEIRPEIGVSKTIEALESINSQISALESKKELKIETAQPLKESIDRAKEGIDEIEKQYKKEFSMLRTLASTGTFIFLFIHELQAFIDDFEEAIKFYSTLIEKQPENIQQQYVDTISSLNDRTEMIKALGDFSGFVIGRESRLEQKEFVLRPIVDRIIASVQGYLNEYKITVNT